MVHAHCPCCGQAVPDTPRLDSVATALGLAGDKRRIFFILAAGRGRFWSVRELVEILWSGEADGGPETAEQCVRVNINVLRNALATYRMRIETKHSGDRSYSRLIRRWNIATDGQNGYALELGKAA